MYNNLPNAGILPVSSTNKTPTSWTKNKEKYRGGADGANISYPPGQLFGLFNYLILDLDVKPDTCKSPDIDKLLAHLENNLKISLDTYTVVTKSGGRHLYYNMPEGISYPDKVGWVQLDCGSIDIRGNNTWVHGPTYEGTMSEWSPGRYMTVKNIPTADFSRLDLLKLLSGGGANGSHSTGLGADGTNVVPFTHDVEAYLKLPVYPKGQRDSIIFTLMNHLYSTGRSYEEAKEFFDANIAPKIEDYEGWCESEFDFGAKWDNIVNRKRHNGQEDKLIVALRSLVYIRDSDRVYDRRYPASKPVKRIQLGVALHEGNNYEYIVDGKVKQTSLKTLWENSNTKYIADSVGYLPDATLTTDLYKENGRVLLNTYNKLSAPLPQPYSLEDDIIVKYNQTLDNVFGASQQTEREIYLSSVRHTFENPLNPRIWSVTMVGAKRTGKGTLWKVHSAMLGHTNSARVDPHLLKKEFNSYMVGHQLLLFDELDNFPGAARMLKSIISDRYVSITAKGADVGCKQRVYYSVDIHSNTTNELKLETNDERHFIVYVNSPPLDYKIGGALDKYANTDSDSSHIGKLKAYILDQPYHPAFNPGKVYKTSYYNQVCADSRGFMANTLVDYLHTENEFTKSDLQTTDSLVKMLMYEGNMLRAEAERVCRYGIPDLVSDGTLVEVAPAGKCGMLESKIGKDKTGKLTKVQVRSNPRVLAIRNADKYQGNYSAIRERFYPHLGSVASINAYLD